MKGYDQIFRAQYPVFKTCISSVSPLDMTPLDCKCSTQIIPLKAPHDQHRQQKRSSSYKKRNTFVHTNTLTASPDYS